MSSPSTLPAHLPSISPAMPIIRRTRMSLTSLMLSSVHSSNILHLICLLRMSPPSLLYFYTPIAQHGSRSAGIVPSNKTTYSLSQLQTALKAQTGAVPFLGCGQNGTVLQEVWYFSHVLGSVSPEKPHHNISNIILTLCAGAIRTLQAIGLYHQDQLLVYRRYSLL